MQNCADWTAGPISKKVRGVNIKNRAWIEILSSKLGLRVDYPKGQGLFSKFSRPNRYLQIWTAGSGSEG